MREATRPPPREGNRFVTEHAGVSVEEADEWLVEFDRLQGERACFFALNRFLLPAIAPVHDLSAIETAIAAQSGEALPKRAHLRLRRRLS
jgi:hypothetical protein